MNVIKTVRNYYFYCGIEKDEYNAVKKDAYISNFEVWKILHFLMAAVFCLLYFASLQYSMMETNRWFYLIGFLYSVCAIVCFFHFEKRLHRCAVLNLYIHVIFIPVCMFH